MSTRAIIAKPVRGGYETAWCWNDGGLANLGYDLAYFRSEEDVDSLINLHSFSCIGDREEMKWWKRYNALGDKITELPNGMFARQHIHNGNVVAGEGENGFFRDIRTMLEQDLSFVYVFRDGKWDIYR